MNSIKEQNNRQTTGRTSPNLTLWLTKIYRCGFTCNGYNTAMKKALAHLPELKWDEVEQFTPCVKKLHEVTEAVCQKKIESFA